MKLDWPEACHSQYRCGSISVGVWERRWKRKVTERERKSDAMAEVVGQLPSCLLEEAGKYRIIIIKIMLITTKNKIAETIQYIHEVPENQIYRPLEKLTDSLNLHRRLRARTHPRSDATTTLQPPNQIFYIQLSSLDGYRPHLLQLDTSSRCCGRLPPLYVERTRGTLRRILVDGHLLSMRPIWDHGLESMA